jgi:DNA repair protein RecO (recombination protein O)
MNLVCSECIILRQRDFKERDRLITFLARDRGKLSGIARGAKVITGRGVGAFEPFTHGILHFAESPSGGLVQIRKMDLLPPHLFLQTDYERFLHFTYFTELIEQSSVAVVDSEAFFVLLLRGLRRAAALPKEALPALRLEFELDLLGALGLQPEWKRCVSCGGRIFVRESAGIVLVRAEPHQFDVQAGGLRCPDCLLPGAAHGLAPATLSQFAPWRAAAAERAAAPGADAGGAAPEGATAREPGLDREAFRELERAIRAHMQHHLEREPRSLDLVDEAEHGLNSSAAATSSTVKRS